MRFKIIACETIGEEIKTLIKNKEIQSIYIKFGLHLNPDELHNALQREIDQTEEDVDTILFGYGLCSRGTLGLEARKFRLVIPKLDDCIALFLGSREEYIRQCRKAPGTFYLTKGWIECGDDPYSEYLKLCEKYCQEKAYRLEKLVIENYTRLTFINSGDKDVEKYRGYARKVADFFGLLFEEIPGSNLLIRKLVEGDWDKNFIIVEPWGSVRYEQFFNMD